jgi:hypothetical protein
MVQGLAEYLLITLRVSATRHHRPGALPKRQGRPCHPPAFRKRFWSDVLRSLEMSFDLLAAEARSFNQERLRFRPDEYISDLEARIAALRAKL